MDDVQPWDTFNIVAHVKLTLSPNSPRIPVGPGRPGSPKAPFTPCSTWHTHTHTHTQPVNYLPIPKKQRNTNTQKKIKINLIKSCSWPGSLSLPEAQGCLLVQFLPVGKQHHHVILLGRACQSNMSRILKIFLLWWKILFLANIYEEKYLKKWSWRLFEVWFIMQSSVCVCEWSVLISMLYYPFFLAAGSDVKNKGLSVYEFLFYEYLLSSRVLHY